MIQEVFELKGSKQGPTSIILAGVHGDEKYIMETVREFLTHLTIESGRIIFVCGNPIAIKAGKRFMESDLNRMFKKDTELSRDDKKSYEYERAQFLKKYLDQAEVLLDLHTSHTPGSNPFVICEKNAMEIVRFLPIDQVVSGFDEVEPGGTDYYMNSIGKIGICIECGFTGDPNSALVAQESVLAFLKACGHIKSDLAPRKQLKVKVSELYLTKTDKFVLSKPYNDFENVSAGQVIGMDGGEEVRAVKDGLILFARNRNSINAEAFIFGEKVTKRI